MIEIIIAIIGPIVGALIVFFLNFFFGDKIKDWYSIKQKSLKKEDGTVTDVIIKTRGPLSYKNRPIIIHNTGTINKIEFREDQKDSASATPIDDSTVVVIQKKPIEGGLTFKVKGSGTTNVSGST